MKTLLYKLIEPKNQISPERRLFSDKDISRLIIPLFFEQLLVMLVGIADRLGLLVSGGSDYHGTIKQVSIGESMNRWVTMEDDYMRFIRRIQ